MMNAHFAAAVPNLRIMEHDVDRLPWDDALFTLAPKIEDGHISVSLVPGWGPEPNEEAIRDRPPKVRTAYLGIKEWQEWSRRCSAGVVGKPWSDDSLTTTGANGSEHPR